MVSTNIECMPLYSLISYFRLCGVSNIFVTGCSCSVNWEVRSTNTTTYVIYMFFLGLVVPATVITYSYVSIVMVMRSVRNVTIYIYIIYIPKILPLMSFLFINQFTLHTECNPSGQTKPQRTASHLHGGPYDCRVHGGLDTIRGVLADQAVWRSHVHWSRNGGASVVVRQDEYLLQPDHLHRNEQPSTT